MLAVVGNAGYGTYFIFGSFCFAMFFFSWFFVPETKGISLEKMDDIFGVTDHGEYRDEENARGSSSPSHGDLKEAAMHIEDDRPDVRTAPH